MRFLNNALRHFTKPAKTNSRRHHHMVRAVAEVLEQRVLLSSFVVNSLGDQASITAGTLTLRQAIAEANADAGPDTITFQAGLTGTITLGLGQLELSDFSGETTITGPGADVITVDGNNASSVFQINGFLTAAISGLTITDGNAGTAAGGGILTYGTLTLSDSLLTNNTDGGIANFGNTTITNCTISNNVRFEGGGISNEGLMTIADCTISGNTAFTNGGGGVYNHGTLDISASTISDNTSSSETSHITLGGGIYNSGDTTISNSTITGNTALHGGGIYNVTDLAQVVLTNCTISANSGGGVSGEIGALALNNTIIAGNTAADGVTPADLNTSSATGSYNLIGTGGSGGLANYVNGNIVGVADPMLGPLQNNGGMTETMALLAGSPAIGEGSTALATAAGITTDQIGTARGAPSCIGAFELPIANQTTGNANYVNALYHDVLGRSADTSGFDNWTGFLDNGTATYHQVALGFTNSLEFYNDTINSFYENYLGRAASTAELASYASLLPLGESLESIRVAVASLPEFIAHNDSGGSNDGYISALYSLILGRSPDTAGQTYWEGILAGPPGAVTAVAAGVIYSAENYDGLVNGYYETYLHCAATTDEIAAGEAQFVLGASDQAIIAGIISSPEYLTLNNVI